MVLLASHGSLKIQDQNRVGYTISYVESNGINSIGGLDDVDSNRIKYRVETQMIVSMTHRASSGSNFSLYSPLCSPTHIASILSGDPAELAPRALPHNTIIDMVMSLVGTILARSPSN